MKKTTIKKFIIDNYSLFILTIFIIGVILFAVIKKDSVRITLNDNLDSNIPIYKMIRDNHLFWKPNESIPFLGGTILRSQYKIEFSFTSWIFYLCSPLVAYYIVFILKVLLSALGFYFLAKKINDYKDFSANVNIWCFCGFLYGILGTWPMAAIGFASLPWLCLCVYVIYKTGKKRYIPILLIFIFTMSFILLGIFTLFYLFIVFFIISVKEKRICFPLLYCLTVLIIGFFLANCHFISQGYSGSVETIKSLRNAVYTESFFESLSNFRKAFLFSKHYYHAGGAPLKYIVIPFCSLYLFSRIISSIKQHKIKKYDSYIFTIYILILFNVICCCFDKNYMIRRLIPFANGFYFWRFICLNPFLWLILLAVICDSFKWDFKRDILILALLAILFDPRYNQRNSMYNELYWNNPFLTNRRPEANHEWLWKEYYSEKLFNEIKSGINYDGSWSIAYGVEPSVLQYNGIKTLDGYFPNYSLKYHYQFQKLIQPELDIDEMHAKYWASATGRAYVWSPEWIFIAFKELTIEETPLYIDINAFKEMNGKYIFSRVKISNWNELGIVPIGREYKMKGSPYKIYVYMVQK